MGIVALIFAGITFCICLIIFKPLGKSKRQKFIDKAREKGDYTEGVYVSSKRHRGDRDYSREDRGKAYRDDTLWVKYEYMVKGKKYYKSYGFQSPGCASIDYPYRITIFYDAKNPKKAYSNVEESEKQRKMRGWYLTIFFVILIYGMVRNL